MFVLENKQVMKKEIIGKNIILTHLGYENEIKFKRIDKIRKKAQWYKFNIETKQYEINTKNTTPILYQGVEYKVNNGAAEIIESKAEIKQKYIDLIKEAQLLGENEEIIKLQEEWKNIKAEYENQ